MKTVLHLLLAGASVLPVTTAVQAQDLGSEAASAAGDDEIIVTARRRDENIQDVPLSVNAVSSDTLEKLNIRSFQDIAAIVPGLSLSGGAGTLRGVSFNQFASGFNSTVEFYLNDAIATNDAVFQQQFDIGQIEVLRGPQGTLRGRASPSGSITVTTRRPNMNEVGGSINMTGTSLGGVNAQAAIGLPIIPGVLAVRLAGLVDRNSGNRVKSIYPTPNPFSRTEAGRATVRFTPTDSLSFTGVYQKLWGSTASYTQVESASIADSSLPVNPARITAGDRLSVENFAGLGDFVRESINVQAQWGFAGQQLNYVFSKNTSVGLSQTTFDSGDVFGPTGPANLNARFGQNQGADSGNVAHEVRLSSQTRLFGALDYIVGYFHNVTHSIQSPQSPTVLYFPRSNTASIILTPLLREAENRESSFFGNLTLHIGEHTELSGGLRRIHYGAVGSVKQGAALTPVAAAAQNDSFNAWIYTASLKHNVSDDLMVYATTGSSWRPGITVLGDFSLARSALENQFTLLPPETSKSYEIGLKSAFLDRHLHFNVAAFYQNFQNYPFRSSGGQYFVETADIGAGPFQRISQFNFVGAVPVKIWGLEAELSYQSENLDLSASGSYAKGKISNGLVPCNDYFPRDGVPDSGSNIPNVGDILATGSTLSACRVNYRSSQTPLWNLSLQGEYRMPVSTATKAFLRGQASVAGNSQNDPLNSLDNVPAYAILNLYAGLRGNDGSWEVAVYGKNITGTERVLSRGQTPLSTGYRPNGGAAVQVASTYREVSLNAPREFGLNLRYSFGSR